MWTLAVGALVILGGMLSLFAWTRALLADQQTISDELSEEIRLLTRVVAESSTEESIAALERRKEAIDALQTSRGEGAAVVRAVAFSINQGQWLTDLSWDGQTVRITGLSFDATAGADVMDGLWATGCFTDVQLQGVDTPGADGKRRFRIVAKDAPEPCGVIRGELPKAFTPPHYPSMTPVAQRPPLLRWEAEMYRVTALVPGKQATVQDPDGRSHAVTVGSAMGNPTAKVTFITEAAVILSLDEVVDAATDLVVSRIVELPLDPD